MRRNLRKIVIGIEQFTQRSQTVEDSRLHRAQRTFQHDRNFLVAQPLAESQDERMPLTVGQLGYLRPQTFLPFGDF